MITVLKWGAGSTALLLLLFATLALTGRKTFHTEIHIPASPEVVWEVLMDTKSYPAWNPVFVDVEGSYRNGAMVVNKVQSPDGVLTIKARISEFVPLRKLRQQGGLSGLLTFDHSWELVPVNGGTRLIQLEIDRGAYLWFWDSSWVQPAYQQTSAAVKERVLLLLHGSDE